LETRRLGASEVEVPVVGMGCWVIGDESCWGKVDEEEAVATVHQAIDLGANLFDTAEGYGGGASERLLGRALEGRRDKAVVATKASGRHHSASEMPKGLEASLERLRTDYVDVYFLHWPNRKIPFDETMTALLRLKEQGKIRAACVSNFGPGDMTDLVKAGVPDANQLPYSLFWRQIEAEILPACREHGTGVVAYSPIAMGLLTGKFRSLDDVPDSNRRHTRLFRPDSLEIAFKIVDEFRTVASDLGCTLAQLSIAWVIAQPGVACTIPGAKNREQLRDNVAAAGVKLTGDVVERMRELSQPLLEHLGPDPDMWDMDRYR
jgi:aryl-alcohol dehydrogenase-like predicted oxidoreductase